MINYMLTLLILLVLYAVYMKKNKIVGGDVTGIGSDTLLALIIAAVVVAIILFMVMKVNPEPTPEPIPVPVHPVVVGGCKGTRYGCCPDGMTARSDYFGSNCYYPVPPHPHHYGTQSAGPEVEGFNM